MASGVVNGVGSQFVDARQDSPGGTFTTRERLVFPEGTLMTVTSGGRSVSVDPATPKAAGRPMAADGVIVVRAGGKNYPLSVEEKRTRTLPRSVLEAFLARPNSSASRHWILFANLVSPEQANMLAYRGVVTAKEADRLQRAVVIGIADVLGIAGQERRAAGTHA